MLIEYGHEGQLYGVADASVDASQIVTFRFREPVKLVRNECEKQPWVKVRVEFLDDETAKVEYPDTTGIRGAVLPHYQRPGESLIIDIGDSYVFHCRIQW